MNYEIEDNVRRIGNQFYFKLTREDGVEGVLQLDIAYIIELEYEDDIEWGDE